MNSILFCALLVDIVMIFLLLLVLFFKIPNWFRFICTTLRKYAVLAWYCKFFRIFQRDSPYNCWNYDFRVYACNFNTIFSETDGTKITVEKNDQKCRISAGSTFSIELLLYNIQVMIAILPWQNYKRAEFTKPTAFFFVSIPIAYE